MTLTPGVYDAIPPEQYHRDELTPDPSLSRSGIVTLLNGTLADYAAQNPRLTQWPELMRESTDATDIGEVAHAMILGTGASFIVKDPWDFVAPKTNKPYETWSGQAKEWRDQIRSEGYIQISRDTNAMAMQISAKLTGVLNERFGWYWEFERKNEQTVIWQRRLNDGSDIWCRARLDALLPDGTIIDVKTTALPLTDVALGREIALKGLDVQACWYQDGYMTVTDKAERNWETRPFIFAYVQSVPPYAVRLVNLDDPEVNWPLSMTRMNIDLAAHRFGAALKSGKWDGDSLDAKPICPPWWKEQQAWKLIQAGLLEETE